MAFKPRMNWKDKERVIEYAKSLNDALRSIQSKDKVFVIQYHDRLNFNICHRSRSDLWDRDDVTVIWGQEPRGNEDASSNGQGNT
jgi:tRNA (Thr-GGU) A37 N-methylase